MVKTIIVLVITAAGAAGPPSLLSALCSELTERVLERWRREHLGLGLGAPLEGAGPGFASTWSSLLPSVLFLPSPAFPGPSEEADAG